MDLIEKYLGEKLEKIKKSRVGQYKSKSEAAKEAKKLTQTTGIKHTAEKSKAYREGGMKEVEVWTVVATGAKSDKKY